MESECSVANITKHVLVFGKRFRGVLITWMVNCCVLNTLINALYVELQVCLNSMANCSFQITHNVSSDQSPIATNRPSVTLYGVQPGETYTVSVETISRIKPSFLKAISFRIEHEPTCAFPDHNEGSYTMSLAWLIFVLHMQKHTSLLGSSCLSFLGLYCWLHYADIC